MPAFLARSFFFINYLFFGSWVLLFLFIPSVEASTFLESAVKDSTGARALGMGGALVANARGPEALFYNPTGLADLGFSYTRGNVDTDQNFFDQNSYDFLTLGSFGYGTWVRRNLNGEEVKVSAWGYGNFVRKGGWGLTYKTVTSASGTGNSTDIGLLRLVHRDLLFGALLQDVFRNNLDVRSSVRVGLAYGPGGEDMVYLLDADIRRLRDTSGPEVEMHYGVEMGLSDSFVGRAGWHAGRYTAGLTLQLPFLVVDYAIAVDLITNRETIRTLGVRFGGH